MPVDLQPIGCHRGAMKKRRARTSIPMSEDLLARVAAYAVADERTLVREVVALVKEALDRRDGLVEEARF